RAGWRFHGGCHWPVGLRMRLASGGDAGRCRYCMLGQPDVSIGDDSSARPPPDPLPQLPHAAPFVTEGDDGAPRGTPPRSFAVRVSRTAFLTPLRVTAVSRCHHALPLPARIFAARAPPSACTAGATHAAPRRHVPRKWRCASAPA